MRTNKLEHGGALLAAVFLGLGCGSLALVSADLGGPVLLKIGQGAEIADTGLRLGFLAVREDSRCPPDVQCFWEGVATVAVSAEKAGQPRTELLLATTNKRGYSTRAEYSAYEIELTSLTPAHAGTVEPAAYRATLVVRAK